MPRASSLGGVSPVARPEEPTDDHPERLQAPRSRAHAEDRRIVYRRPRAAPHQKPNARTPERTTLSRFRPTPTTRSSPAEPTRRSRREPAARGSAGSKRSIAPRLTPGRTGRSRSTSTRSTRSRAGGRRPSPSATSASRVSAQSDNAVTARSRQARAARSPYRSPRCTVPSTTHASAHAGCPAWTSRFAPRRETSPCGSPGPTAPRSRSGLRVKAAGKSRVALAHVKLSDKAAATRAKEFWAERFDALEDVLV